MKLDPRNEELHDTIEALRRLDIDGYIDVRVAFFIRTVQALLDARKEIARLEDQVRALGGAP